MNNLLERIQSPADLNQLSPEQLEHLAQEIRERIIDVVSANGGHLASNLGVVELTIALHKVFDFRDDRLLWDVGHQCYVHKLLTGRNKGFETLRQQDGVSGFPSTTESPYDLFDVGHAGTAIATAVGMARGDQALGRDNRTVAMVGDASIVNGVAFEGLNQAGVLKRQLLVILNDNSMGISKTQGGLASYLARMRTSHFYEDVKQGVHKALSHLPFGASVADALDHLKEGFKAAVSPHQIFEQLGLMYVGPVDGHDLPGLIKTLTLLRDIDEPVLLHVHTEKGRGCSFAVADPCTFHSPGKLAVQGDTAKVIPGERQGWTSAFAEVVQNLMRDDPRVFALTAAMPDGTGVAKIRNAFPDRCLDCGIAESCTVDIAAGMAKSGLRPLACIYSTFLQRGFDQVFQEVVLQKLPVVFCIDRAGFVGGDGAVHHGYLDVSYLRSFQNMVLMAPADKDELEQSLRFALTLDGPSAIRYPRDMIPHAFGPAPTFELGRSRLMRAGDSAALLVYGALVDHALQAADLLQADGLNAAVINARFAKPVDERFLAEHLAAPENGPLLTIEDHSVAGGFGSAVLETANRLGLPTQQIHVLGHDAETFYPQGSRIGQLAAAGLDAAGLAQAVRRAVYAGRQSSALTLHSPKRAARQSGLQRFKRA